MVGCGMKIVVFHPVIVPFVFYVFSVKLQWNCHFIVCSLFVFVVFFLNISKYSNEKKLALMEVKILRFLAEIETDSRKMNYLKGQNFRSKIKEVAIGTFIVMATKVNNYAQFKKGFKNLCN